MDSLMATEIRSHIQHEFGVVVPLAKILSGQSVADLTDFLSDERGTRSDSAPAAPLAPAVSEPAPVVEEPVVVLAPSTERGAEIQRFLVERVAKVLALPVDRLNVRKPLNRLGMDSLMATEIRSHIQHEFGVVVPLAKILSGQSVADLTDFLSDELSTNG
ncbi:acyl carrier protein, partial [Streptomyces sp. DSM 41014]